MWSCSINIHAPRFFRAVPVIVSFEFGSDDVFQFDGIGGELPYSVGQFVGRHFILVERPAERLLVELDAVYGFLLRYNIRPYSCKDAFTFTNIERESEILSLVSMHHFLKGPFIRSNHHFHERFLLILLIFLT